MARFGRDLAIAVTACATAAGAQLAFDRLLAVPITPLVTAIGAVVFSAVYSGPIAAAAATILATLWCAVFLGFVRDYAALDILLRSLIFAAEGAILTAGSARLFRIRRELEQSNIRQRQLVDTAAEGILIVNAAGLITYANARSNEMLAGGRLAVEQRRFEEFVFPEDLAAERMRLERRGSAGREQLDRRLRRLDGGEIWVLSCSNPILDERGEFSGMLLMMTDITERKAAETALRRSEEKYRGLFENVLEGVYQSTPDGRILAANPMLLTMLGLSSESELNDVNISRDLYVDSRVRSRLLEILERDGSFQNVEYELRRRDGEIITVLENARVVRDANGEVLYYEGTLADITERKRVEEQLRQAQKSEALATLAAGLAQDFNSTMTVMTGYCALLEEDPGLSGSARQLAGEALKAAQRATMLTGQLAAVNAGSSPEEKPLDVSRAIRRLEPSLRAALGHDVELRFSFEDEAAIFMHEVLLEQILVNLTTNAREAMPGGGLVEITTGSARIDAEFCAKHGGAKPGAYLRLCVRDTGIGIPRHLIGRLTDPMFSMGKSRMTGLGLYIVQEIASRHGGFLQAESTPGMGATFSVYLPLAGAPNPRQPVRPGLSGADRLRRARPGETILLVEDDPVIRRCRRDALEHLGYRVITAADPEDAERVAESSGRLDLLITNGSAESGTELARRLTARRPALKYLVVSSPEDQLNAIAQGGAENQPRKTHAEENLGRKVRQILDAAADE